MLIGDITVTRKLVAYAPELLRYRLSVALTDPPVRVEISHRFSFVSKIPMIKEIMFKAILQETYQR